MSDTFERFLKFVALAVIILIGVTGVYAARGLHSDGSAWLIEMLPRGGFYIFDPHRAYAQVLVQAPVALAIWLGTVDLNALIRLHSFGFVSVPLIFWLGALLLQFKNKLFWFFLMAFTVSYLRSNFFAAGEFSLAYALTAFCTAVLLRPKIGQWLALAMALAAVVLTHAYEATLFLGTFLIMLSVLRLRKVSDDSFGTRVLLYISIALFFASVYVGGRSTFFQRSYDGQGAANLGALTEIHVLYLMIVPALIACLFTEYTQKLHRWICASVLTFVGFYLLYAFRWDHRNISYGYYSYAYRVLCCFLLLGVLSLAALWRFWLQVFKANSMTAKTNRYLILGALAFFLSMAWLMLYHTYGYYKWAQRFEHAALSLHAHTPIDKTAINRSHGLSEGYNWMWGNPFTSILLRGNAEAIVLNNSRFVSSEPSVYDGLYSSDPARPATNSKFEIYPLVPFKKSGLLFPSLFDTNTQ